jgi:hypothetical protein
MKNFTPIGDVVAHSGPQDEAPAVLQFGDELALEDQHDVAFLGKPFTGGYSK